MYYTENKFKDFKSTIEVDTFKLLFRDKFLNKLKIDIQINNSIPQNLIKEQCENGNLIRNIFRVYKELFRLGVVILDDSYMDALVKFITDSYIQNELICKTLSKAMLSSNCKTIQDYILYLFLCDSEEIHDYVVSLLISELFKKPNYENIVDISLDVTENIYKAIFSYEPDWRYFSISTLTQKYHVDIVQFIKNVRYKSDSDMLYDIFYKISLPNFLIDSDNYYLLLQLIRVNYNRRRIIY